MAGFLQWIMDYGGDKGAFLLSSLQERMIIKKRISFPGMNCPLLNQLQTAWGSLQDYLPAGGIWRQR